MPKDINDNDGTRNRSTFAPPQPNAHALPYTRFPVALGKKVRIVKSVDETGQPARVHHIGKITNYRALKQNTITFFLYLVTFPDGFAAWFWRDELDIKGI